MNLYCNSISACTGGVGPTGPIGPTGPTGAGAGITATTIVMTWGGIFSPGPTGSVNATNNNGNIIITIGEFDAEQNVGGTIMTAGTTLAAEYRPSATVSYVTPVYVTSMGITLSTVIINTSGVIIITNSGDYSGDIIYSLGGAYPYN